VLATAVAARISAHRDRTLPERKRRDQGRRTREAGATDQRWVGNGESFRCAAGLYEPHHLGEPQAAERENCRWLVVGHRWLIADDFAERWPSAEQVGQLQARTPAATERLGERIAVKEPVQCGLAVPRRKQSDAPGTGSRHAAVAERRSGHQRGVAQTWRGALGWLRAQQQTQACELAYVGDMDRRDHRLGR
jgi:hypothetical protein